MNGWKWDRRRGEKSSENRTQYLSTLGGHTVGLRDGTQRSHWQSGVVEGCAYTGIVYKFINDDYAWTPQVNIGTYGWLFQKRFLYSDYSYTGRFSTDGVENGLMFKDLREDCKENTISVALYKRDASFTSYKYYDFKYVDEFTGALDGNTRLTTGLSSDNLETRKHEYLVRNNRVYLNGIWKIEQSFTTSATYLTPPMADLPALLEAQGDSQLTGRNVFLEYHPVQRGSVKVWVNEDDTVVLYNPVNYLSFSKPDAREVEVDYDSGIITMPGYQADDLMLSQSLTDIDTEIFVYPDGDKLKKYPSKGVLIIGDEQIAYFEKTLTGFRNLIRGYEGSTIDSHDKGTLVEHRRMGLGTAGKIYVEYTAVPRIDYEVTEHLTRTANKNPWLNVKPLANVEPYNIVQILPGEISLDSIVLETDTPLLGGNLYGPLFYGTDVSSLIATGLDTRGNPVEDVEITIQIIDGSGLLNGIADSVTDITNTLGQIYANYTHPLNTGDYELYVSSVDYDGPDTLLTVPNILSNTDLNDVWVFQILKYDKHFGSVGLPLEVTGEGVATAPYGNYYLDLDGVVTDLYRGGVLSIDISGVTYYRNITWTENLYNGSGVLYTRLYIDATLSSATGDTAYLLEPDAVSWNPNLLNGVRVILYEYRDDVLHPLTGELGAFYPLKPDALEGEQLRFIGRQLPIPDAADNSDNLGGYLVIAPGEVSLQAFGIDPYSGRTIESNIIRLSLELPSFFRGVDDTGSLPVPSGWRFPSEEHNIGSGLGGGNFITINPSAVGSGQFTLVMEF